MDYAVKIRIKNGWRIELAHHAEFDALNWLQKHFNHSCAERIDYLDKHAGIYRYAITEAKQLKAVAFMETAPLSINSAWLQSLLEKTELNDTDRISLLSGKPSDPALDEGKTVCSCFGVGVKKIERIIIEQNAGSVEAIGRCCKAGTNCGSCVPELKSILQQMADSAKPSGI